MKVFNRLSMTLLGLSLVASATAAFANEVDLRKANPAPAYQDLETVRGINAIQARRDLFNLNGLNGETRETYAQVVAAQRLKSIPSPARKSRGYTVTPQPNISGPSYRISWGQGGK